MISILRSLRLEYTEKSACFVKWATLPPWLYGVFQTMSATTDFYQYDWSYGQIGKNRLARRLFSQSTRRARRVFSQSSRRDSLLYSGNMQFILIAMNNILFLWKNGFSQSSGLRSFFGAPAMSLAPQPIPPYQQPCLSEGCKGSGSQLAHSRSEKT